MRITYESDASIIPRARKPTIQKNRTFEIVEELLKSDKNVAVVEFDNKHDVMIFTNSLRNLIETHNPPVSQCVRGLFVYIKKEERGDNK